MRHASPCRPFLCDLTAKTCKLIAFSIRKTVCAHLSVLCSCVSIQFALAMLVTRCGSSLAVLGSCFDSSLSRIETLNTCLGVDINKNLKSWSRYRDVCLNIRNCAACTFFRFTQPLKGSKLMVLSCTPKDDTSNSIHPNPKTHRCVSRPKDPQLSDNITSHQTTCPSWRSNIEDSKPNAYVKDQWLTI